MATRSRASACSARREALLFELGRLAPTADRSGRRQQAGRLKRDLVAAFGVPAVQGGGLAFQGLGWRRCEAVALPHRPPPIVHGVPAERTILTDRSRRRVIEDFKRLQGDHIKADGVHSPYPWARPDGQAHVCISPLQQIRCVALPGSA